MNDPHAPIPELDPVLDVARLQEIADLDLFAPEVSGILSELAKEASQKLDLPLGMVNIVLDEAQYIAAHHGVGGWIAEAQGTPVEWAFCRFAVRDRTDFVVEDAHVHERVKDNPLVTEDGLRCYAGIPLITSRGHALGSFCVAGTEARSFSEEEMQVLRTLAAEAVRRIEARRNAGA
ncbi:GAF domain-containing protein [Massilia consociata]|uniref:GAF domain-containing protein n=1 Tax=Massilia consociata TaxID=760117 RepID=A0ABV6FBF3_9BURK